MASDRKHALAEYLRTWRPRVVKRDPHDHVHRLQSAILRVLVAAGGDPVHVDTIATELGMTPSRTSRLLLRHGHGLWVHAGSFHRWRTTLRRNNTTMDVA